MSGVSSLHQGEKAATAFVKGDMGKAGVETVFVRSRPVSAILGEVARCERGFLNLLDKSKRKDRFRRSTDPVSE